MDEAIGNVQTVEDFVTAALTNLLGVQVTKDRKGYSVVTGNLPPQLTDLLPVGQIVKVSFESPTPEGYFTLAVTTGSWSSSANTLWRIRFPGRTNVRHGRR